MEPLLRPMGRVGLAIALGIAYFLAAEFSLLLLTKPDGVAVFWPAAGLSSGAIIALGPRARIPVVSAVLIASAAASLLGDRNIPAATIFALCNAAEPLIVAWLIERHFGARFPLESMRGVLVFFAAATVGPAISGSIATFGFVQFYNSAAPALSTWLNWLSSDALGIIMVAPVLIGLSDLRKNIPRRWEIVEGTALVAALAVVSAIAFGSNPYRWYATFPIAVFLPILLAAHCRPVFAALAALILGSSVIWATTHGVGSLGEIPDLADRAYAARATLLTISICTLVLAALFAERRESEASLQTLADRNVQLALAGKAALVGTYVYDVGADVMQISEGYAALHGLQEGSSETTRSEWRARVHPEDLTAIENMREQAYREKWKEYANEYRIVLAGGEIRWIESRSFITYYDGRPRRVIGVNLDATERKRAQQVAQRLASIVESSYDAIVSKDIDGHIVSWNEGAERLFGYPAEEVIGKCISVLIPADRQHEKDSILGRIRRGHRIRLYETVRRRKDGSQVDVSLTISPLRDHAGSIIGASKIARDISARKRADEHQRILNAELDHRVKNLLATVIAIIMQTREAGGSLGDFVAELDSRIRSLARTHELLSQNRWHGASLEEIAQRELRPYGTSSAEICGPPTTLKAEAAQAIGMVLHELTTNAAKHGALSKAGGRVLLRWARAHNGSDGRLAIEWKEMGGPPAREPHQAGYGTSIIRELIPFELGGTADIDYTDGGLHCRLEVSTDWVRREAKQAIGREKLASEKAAH